MTRRRVALNEVLRLSKRVFLALGAGPGCEYDPACAVVWLESRGLPGLEMLWQDRQAPRYGVSPRATTEDDPVLRIDGNGSSGAWLAAAAADWLAAHGEQASVEVAAVRSPLWFIPDLAWRGGNQPVWITARNSGNELVFAAGWDGRGVSLRFPGEPEALAGTEATVSLGRGELSADGLGQGRALCAQELSARHAASLAAGVEVDESRWRSLYDLARGALVPESEASRIRGAGAVGE